MCIGKWVQVSLVLTLLLIVAGFASSQGEGGLEEVIVQFSDARGDDVGAGALLYPEHEVYVQGLFDLVRFQVSRDDDSIYFDFGFATITNPFQAPEGYFHQRLEVYIRTGESQGQTSVPIGAYTLQTASELGWNIRLSIAPFDESRLYLVDKDSQIRVSSDGIRSYRLPDSETLRVQVNSALLPQPDSAWGYYVLVGAFDGLAQGFWRDLGDGPWQVGGNGIPVFDILAPRFGKHGQRAQLGAGVLHPVSAKDVTYLPWLVGTVFVLVCLGVFFLWRWRRGRS